MKPQNTTKFAEVAEIMVQIENISKLFWRTKAVRKLLDSKEHYDLVLMVAAGTDSLLGLAHRFKAPVIMLCTVGSNIMVNKYVANPTPWSYIKVNFC